MALIRCDFFAESIDQGTSMTVVLPQAEGGVAEPPPVLYLLHGLGDNDTAWTRFTSIERYADDHGLAVVMPQVQRSFYADEAHGAGFWTFLSEELPRVVSQFFRMSTRREDTFVAGLSMGGYGVQVGAARPVTLRGRGEPVRATGHRRAPAHRRPAAHPGDHGPGLRRP